MFLFLLSLLATESVQSAAIGYPYHSLWTYDPIKSGSVHGYLRYLDNNAAGGLVGINNQQPVYAVRQIKYFNSAAPATETLAIKNSEDIIKARETYLRAASLQQYQNLKSNIDALRAEGKEPSAEKLSKLQMLQRIAFTSDFSLIAELPEVKSILQDLEAKISGLHSESVQQALHQPRNVDQSQGEIKTYVGNSNVPLVAIDETPEQKQAHEDHLRIHNDQIAHLKQLESEHQKYVLEASSKSSINQPSNEDKSTVDQVENAKALAELERATQEHLRLWNEAKLRNEHASEKVKYERANQQQISAFTNDQNIYNPKQIILKNLSQETQQPNQQLKQQSVKNVLPALERTQPELTDNSNLKSEQARAAEHISGQQQVIDTPEIVRAPAEHLRIVNEAISKAQSESNEEEKQQQMIDSNSQSQSQKDSSSSINYRAEQSLVEEAPEDKKESEEQLRLVHEANLRAQYVEQQELKYKHESQTPILKSQYVQEHHSANQPEISQNVQETPEAVKARLINDAETEKHIVLPSQGQQQQSSQTQTGETAEVQRARAEHLRIFNSIKSHAEQEQAKQNSRTFPRPSSDQKEILDFSIGEERLLELERLREAERLQKEQELLEMDLLSEAERLAEENRQMEANLMRLRLEDEQRFEMERQLEEKRLQQEKEELQKQNNAEYQEIIIQNDSIDQQPQIAIISSSNIENAGIVEKKSQQYASNPFLKIDQVSSEPANRLEHSASQTSSLLKSIPTQNSFNTQHHDNTVPHYIPSSHHSNGIKQQYIKDDNIKHIYASPSSFQSDTHSSGTKHQYVKEDNIKHTYTSTASPQPADTEHHIFPLHQSSGIKHPYVNKDDSIKGIYRSGTSSQPDDAAVALLALEKATNIHFRAHELALEQLRLARLQNPITKDCN